MSIFSDLSRIYSTSFIRALLSSQHHNFLHQLSYSFSFIKEAFNNDDYNLLFDEGYKMLLENYRSEYIYKSEIYGRIRKQNKIKGINGVLTEVRSGKSIADLLWLNGTSIAYEIKTEIDTNRRLEQQIESYQHLYKETVVVTHERNIQAINAILPNTTGIMYLTKNGMLKVYRDSVEFAKLLNPEVMYLTLRRTEYEAIILEAYGFVPNVSDAHIYNECKKMFVNIPPLQAHDLMVKQLKKRSSINIKLDGVEWPKSISFLMEKGGLRKREIDQFKEIIFY